MEEPRQKRFMFPFMRALEKAYAEKDKALDKNSESYELSLLMRQNSYFFDKIDTFEKYVKTFMLEGYEKLALEKYIRSSKINKNTIDEYRPIIRKFVREAKRFIDNRSKRIVQKLVEKYPDLT